MWTDILIPSIPNKKTFILSNCLYRLVSEISSMREERRMTEMEGVSILIQKISTRLPVMLNAHPFQSFVCCLFIWRGNSLNHKYSQCYFSLEFTKNYFLFSKNVSAEIFATANPKGNIFRKVEFWTKTHHFGCRMAWLV